MGQVLLSNLPVDKRSLVLELANASSSLLVHALGCYQHSHVEKDWKPKSGDRHLGFQLFSIYGRPLNLIPF